MDAVTFKVKKGQLKSKLREVKLSIDLLDPGNYDLTHKDDYNNEINSVKDKVMKFDMTSRCTHLTHCKCLSILASSQIILLHFQQFYYLYLQHDLEIVYIRDLLDQIY